MQVKGNLLYRNVNARSCSVTSPVIEPALLLNTSQSQLPEALGDRTHWEHEYHHHMSEETLGWDLTEIKPRDIFQHPKSSKQNCNFLIFNLGPIQANISGLKLSPADSWLRSARVYPSYCWQGPVLGAPTIGTEPGRMWKVLFFPSNGSVAPGKAGTIAAAVKRGCGRKATGCDLTNTSSHAGNPRAVLGFAL